jgi:hypothetical protein
LESRLCRASAFLCPTTLLPLRTRTAQYTGYALLLAMAGVAVISWAGATSLLISVGQALMAIARMQQDVCRIFILLFVGQSLWAVHDILVGSLVAIAADAVGLLVAGWMLGRRWKERRNLARISACAAGAGAGWPGRR